MRIRRPARGLLAAATLVAALAVTAGPSTATSDPKVQGDEGTLPNVDSRQGRKAPSQGQLDRVKQGSQARFNRFGSPETLSDPGSYLATGLSDNDVTAAREYLRANAELLGLSQAEVADLELLNRAPIGTGSAVLFRQRFGDLPAGRDGLVAVGVVDGKVASLSSSLATDTPPHRRRRPSRRRTPYGPPPTRRAIRPARSGTRGRRTAGPCSTSPATPIRPASGSSACRPRPTACGRRTRSSLMDLERDARSHELRRRGDRRAARPRRHRRPCGRQPGVEGLPRLAAARLLVDRHARALVLDIARRRLREGGREPVLAAAVGRRRGDEHADVPDARQQRAGDGEVELERRQPAGHELLSSSPTRDYVYPWTNQWFTSALQPGRRSRRSSRTTSMRRGRTSTRCTTGCTTGRTSSASRRPTFNAQAFNFGQRRRRRTTRSTATPRPAASSAGRPASRRATTPTSSRRPTASCR